MSGKALKIFVTAVAVVGALSGLLYATLREDTQFYKHVDEVMSDPSSWHGRRLQLHGYVAGIERKRNSLEYRFNVQSNGSVVQASYTGVVPDTFKEGAEVVLKGTLGADGFHVERNGVMAKCPSKYEPSKGTTPNTSGS
ncbi:MAG TPA: cytochrome c maturation protein CcmE [Vicinamibacterales bacterium]|nr:cytochrome c maturation protein CcmE [Vicinamibacterales bacterium]